MECRFENDPIETQKWECVVFVCGHVAMVQHLVACLWTKGEQVSIEREEWKNKCGRSTSTNIGQKYTIVLILSTHALIIYMGCNIIIHTYEQAIYKFKLNWVL